MIINCSRAKTALLCWRKAFNNHHRQLEGPRSMPLIDGGAFHDAVAGGLATPSDHNWTRALAEAKIRFDASIKESTIPEEQLFTIANHWEMIEKMVEIYRVNYNEEEYQVIQPECSFDVPLPNSHHNCVWLHHLEYVSGRRLAAIERWGPPAAQAIHEHRITSPHATPDPTCRCWQPHRLVGKTDALVKWKGNLWLMEHKTTAIKGEQFWDQWDIDLQPTTYMYGMWKSLGIRPRGFVMDAIYKPSEPQIAAWNKARKYGAPKKTTDYMDYERRPYLKTEEDLYEVERQYIDLCNDWESKILRGYFPKSNVQGICKLYNRRCDYFMGCLTHDDPKEFEALAHRPDDYVMEKLLAILQ